MMKEFCVPEGRGSVTCCSLYMGSMNLLFTETVNVFYTNYALYVPLTS